MGGEEAGGTGTPLAAGLPKDRLKVETGNLLNQRCFELQKIAQNTAMEK